MSVFIDTNILLRSISPGNEFHLLAVGAVTRLIGDGEPLIVTPQIIAEFWNGATRPHKSNGLGLTIEQAQAELAQIEGFFTIVGETPEVYLEWKLPIATHRVSGVQVHDARLVAAMKVHGVRQILTFDVEDFRRYSDIEALHPATMIV